MSSRTAAAAAAVLLTACLAQAAAGCDARCLHAATLAKVNGLRASLGKAPLLSGTVGMVDNAVAHSRHMAASGDFSHQDLGQVTAYIGCDLFCSGENIAWFSGGAVGAAPDKCFEMWRNSPGHYRNMISDNDYSAIGVFQGANGRVYCTQTLAKERSGAKKTVVGGAKCDLATGTTPATGNGSAAEEPQNTQTTPPAVTTSATTTTIRRTIASTLAPRPTQATTQTQTRAPTQAATQAATQAVTQAMATEVVTNAETATPTPNTRPDQREPQRPVAEEGKCTATYQRCAGEESHDFIPFIGCCNQEDVCQTKTSMGWGKFCLPKRDADAAADAPNAKEPVEDDDANASTNAETHTHWVDQKERKFKLTDRIATFEEECTYKKNGNVAVCILCLAGPHPGICFDSRMLRRRMRDTVTYENAF